MFTFKVSVILPAFNEAGCIGPLVENIRTLYPNFEVIVVDDGSSDDTSRIARQAGATVCRHPYNIGNGAAVKTGIRAAAGEVIVLMDSDGQHDPADIAELLAFMPDYDMVVGARGRKGHAGFLRSFGNRVYNRLASYVAKFAVKDLTSGFRAVKTDLARSFIPLLPNTYSYPTTLTLGILRSGRSVKYTPVQVKPRQGGQSNINFIKDGVRFFMIITRICTLYSPMRVFLPVCFTLFVVGTLNYLYTYLIYGRFTNMSVLMITTSITIFMMSLISEQISQMRFERRESAGHVKKDNRSGVV